MALQGRRRGYGARLFDHALLRARHRGVETIVIHALAENAAMLKIVRNAGAQVEHVGSDAEARLRLPPEDTLARADGDGRTARRRGGSTTVRSRATARLAHSAPRKPSTRARPPGTRTRPDHSPTLRRASRRWPRAAAYHRRMESFPDRAPYARLTPHQMLDALAAAGLGVTGGLMQLNSYENRVVQAALEDGGAVVAKFYRPARWSDAQILEEHAFALELAADDLPVAAPLVLEPTQPQAELALAGVPPTLGHWHAAPETGEDDAGAAADFYRFAVAPRRAGRAPELESPHTLAWIGRLLGRMHRVSARRPFVERPARSIATPTARRPAAASRRATCSPLRRAAPGCR